MLRELATLASQESFRGTDHRRRRRDRQHVGDALHGARRRTRSAAGASCVYPTVCKFFAVDHGPLVELYEKARKVKGVKHLFVGSGVRYDLAQADQKNGARYLKTLVAAPRLRASSRSRPSTSASRC